ncbi:MAG TPA: GatB/YqeY domain-containing protein [Candidatus Saccharimonadales bacterium]|nr:GatB/YqeY domain-containing protein [Candidatus Saccharimonadales bacterium]
MMMEKIAADMKEAMRAKDAARLSTLRLLKSAVEYHKIEKKQEQLTDADITAIIKKQIKQRQDSIESFEKGGRADLVEKEKAELVVLKSYLPEELSAAQVEEVVKATIAEVGATTKTDMGKVMKAVQAKLAGRADNRLVSQLVSANLA